MKIVTVFINIITYNINIKKKKILNKYKYLLYYNVIINTFIIYLYIPLFNDLMCGKTFILNQIIQRNVLIKIV